MVKRGENSKTAPNKKSSVASRTRLQTDLYITSVAEKLKREKYKDLERKRNLAREVVDIIQIDSDDDRKVVCDAGKHHVDKLAYELKCRRCLRLINEPVTLPCDHMLCKSCLKVSPTLGRECVVCNPIYSGPGATVFNHDGVEIGVEQIRIKLNEKKGKAKIYDTDISDKLLKKKPADQSRFGDADADPGFFEITTEMFFGVGGGGDRPKQRRRFRALRNVIPSDSEATPESTTIEDDGFSDESCSNNDNNEIPSDSEATPEPTTSKDDDFSDESCSNNDNNEIPSDSEATPEPTTCIVVVEDETNGVTMEAERHESCRNNNNKVEIGVSGDLDRTLDGAEVESDDSVLQSIIQLDSPVESETLAENARDDIGAEANNVGAENTILDAEMSGAENRILDAENTIGDAEMKVGDAAEKTESEKIDETVGSCNNNNDNNGAGESSEVDGIIMGFDKEISEWILEYLLREVTDTSLISQALSVLPIPKTSPVLMKTISMKIIDSFVRDCSISDSILDILERIAKICSEDKDGLVFLDESIKLAYCMVAVDCTVRFNEGTDNGGGGLYLEAVKRIWRGRIVYLENSSCADLLISDQLRSWRVDIEAAVYDGSVSKRIIAINTRLEALKALRSFSAEAWKTMCPRHTFLEHAAKKMGRYLLMSQTLSGSENLSPVQVETPCSSGMHDLARESVVEKASDTVSTKLPDTTVPVHIERGKAPVQQTTVDPTLMTPVMKRNHPYEDGSAYCPDGDGSLKYAVQTKNQSHERNMNSEPSMQIENQPIQRNMRDRDQMVGENTGAVPVVAFRDKEVENLNALPNCKHVAGNSKRSKRGVQIGDAEDLMVDPNFSLLGSAEVSKVQEALRSSSLGLDAVVNDPLQEALKVADAVMSSIGRTGIIVEPSAQTQDRMDINMANHSNAQHEEAVRTKVKSIPGDGTRVDEGTGDNLGTKRPYQVTDMTRPGLMLRNNTSRTSEWEDEDDLDRTEGPSSSKRLKLPVGRRRYNKRWNSEEEDALRSGVEKYGKGSWKMIVCAYREIFEERTEVDLKDKWRNMMKRGN